MSLRVLVAGAVLGQPMGGVRRHNAELLPRAQARLAAEGGALAVLVGRTAPAFELGAGVERLPSDVPVGPPRTRFVREGRALRAALASARAQGRAFDLVHTAHLPTPGGLALPFSWTVHDLRALERRGLAGWAARAVVRRAARDAALVIAVGEPTRLRLEREFRPRASALVPNGADHLPLLPRAPSAEPYLLCVGHLEPRKGVETLIEALALDAGLPRLVLVGAPKGDAGTTIDALVAHAGLGARVQRRAGVTDDELARLYAGAHAVVSPSRLEGFGLVALEALRAGAPLALSHAAAEPIGLQERVPSFAAGDAAGCARAVRAALDGAGLARAEADELVATHTWDAAAERLVAAWKRAVGR